MVPSRVRIHGQTTGIYTGVRCNSVAQKDYIGIKYNVTLVDNKKISLIVYYKNNKTKISLWKNHPKPNTDLLKERMVVYRFTCPIQGCPGLYIGMTTVLLSKRISCHLHEGNIFRHYRNEHNSKPTQDALLECVEIIARADNDLCLYLKGPLCIEKERLALDTADEVKILPTSMMRPLRRTGNE